MTAAWTSAQTATVAAALIAAAGIVFGLWINGLRSERSRRREFYANALAACRAYREFPYVIKRRRDDVAGEERVRISEALRAIQRDLGYFGALMSIERALEVAVRYRVLVDKTRDIAGAYMAAAWGEPAASDDKAMNVSDVDYTLLERFERDYLTAVEQDLSWWRVWR